MHLKMGSEEVDAVAKADPEDAIVIEDLTPTSVLVLQQDANGDWTAIDDVKGGALDPVMVKDARKLEMQYVHDRGIQTFVSSGKPPRHRSTSDWHGLARHKQRGLEGS